MAVLNEVKLCVSLFFPRSFNPVTEQSGGKILQKPAV